MMNEEKVARSKAIQQEIIDLRTRITALIKEDAELWGLSQDWDRVKEEARLLLEAAAGNRDEKRGSVVRWVRSRLGLGLREAYDLVVNLEKDLK